MPVNVLLYVSVLSLLCMLFREQPWLSGKGKGIAPSEPGFNPCYYPFESLVASGRAFGRNCSLAPVKVLPWCLGILLGTSEPLNKGVTDVKFRLLYCYLAIKATILSITG